MDKPNGTFPRSPTSTSQFMPVNIPDQSLRGESFEQLITNRGIRFLHRQMIPCPNMTSLNDGNHEPNCPVCEGNGFMFYREKEITGLFYSNALERNFEQQGVWEIGTAVVTLPTEYEDGTQADFNTNDELVVRDFTVRMWELKEYEPRAGNLQGLRYPIHNVDHMMAVINNQIKVYELGVDYEIVNGDIHWLITPYYDRHEQHGQVFAVMYFANPSYNVLQHMRELRVSQQMINGVKTSKRLPQQILVKRGFLTRSSETNS